MSLIWSPENFIKGPDVISYLIDWEYSMNDPMCGIGSPLPL